jgi:hypothetical protein
VRPRVSTLTFLRGVQVRVVPLCADRLPERRFLRQGGRLPAPTERTAPRQDGPPSQADDDTLLGLPRLVPVRHARARARVA